MYDQQEVDLPKSSHPFRWESSCGSMSRGRLLALREGEIAALTTSTRQLGVGSRGGAEALAIFRQLFCHEWAEGSLTEPLARINVDEENCFGMFEWKAVREAASRFLPKHTAAAAWKHRNLSHVEQDGLAPMPKDRGPEQGDVAAWLWEWWLPSRRQAAFHGLELTTPQMFSTCRLHTQSGCKKLPTSIKVVLENSPEPTTRCAHCKKMEAWRTCGTWMMVTLCVARSWCRLTCINSTTPMRKLERNETHRKRRSLTAWTT